MESLGRRVAMRRVTRKPMLHPGSRGLKRSHWSGRPRYLLLGDKPLFQNVVTYINI